MKCYLLVAYWRPTTLLPDLKTGPQHPDPAKLLNPWEHNGSGHRQITGS